MFSIEVLIQVNKLYAFQENTYLPLIDYTL